MNQKEEEKWNYYWNEIGQQFVTWNDSVGSRTVLAERRPYGDGEISGSDVFIYKTLKNYCG